MRKGRLLVFVQFAALGALFVLPQGDTWQSTGVLVWLASALTLGAALIGVLAYAALRPSFRVQPEPRVGAPLITVGIYRHIRHPMYTAVLAVAAAMALRSQSLAGVLVWLLLLVDLEVKSRYEDALLLARHPEAGGYQRSTGRFLPGIPG